MTNRTQHFVAIDLGATSGRTILGSLHNGRISLREIQRFPNKIIHANRHCYWDFLHLYDCIISSLRTIADEGISVQSIGIDTWGVDFVLLGEDGQLLGNPYCYRDPHTAGSMQHYFREVLPAETIYAKTGIQFLPFNSLFQFFTLRRANCTALQAAKHILFLPDALTYMLTGQRICEYTIASTSQLLNAHSKTLDSELLASLHLSEAMFGTYTTPGTIIGPLSAEICSQTGMQPAVVTAVAGHDTASAVVAVPAKNPHFAYISSGTWSLMGIETTAPIITTASLQHNFTNEGGAFGTTRFLKNICGMWILEQCRNEWNTPTDYDTLFSEAAQSTPFRSFINPDDAVFSNPASMTKEIQDYCRRTCQPVPPTRGALVRCILESLAMRYRQVFEQLCNMAPFPIECLHIIGGGARNHLLNQYTCNALHIPVIAGPQEATAIGNIGLQLHAAGVCPTLQDIRNTVAQSVETFTYTPADTAAWDHAYQDFTNKTK